MLDTTRIDFTIVNQPGSYDANRFYMIFRKTSPVPVTFIDVRGVRQNRDILVSWDVANEENIGHYEVERSADGSSFGKVHEEVATGSSSYHCYRIRAVGTGGDIKYSNIVKVSAGRGKSLISVYPNPIKEDAVLYADFQNEEAGKYRMQLLNDLGQVVMTKEIEHQGGSSVYSIRLNPQMAHGHYMLQIVRNKDVKFTFKVVY